MSDKTNANTLKLTFWGGAGTVTGANFLLEGANQRFLIDCGLQQGCYKICDDNNRKPFPYGPASIDAVFITHSHIDHVGRLPKLVREGFRGVIYSTPPTKDIAREMLIDSLGVMGKESKKDKLPTIYSEQDVAQTMKLWQTAPYHQDINIGGFAARFRDSGHILGSAMTEIVFNKKKIVFTGDLGNSPSSLLKDCETITDAIYLVIESVYGDRNHEPKPERVRRLEEIIERSIKGGGVLMIPAFSLERTQELLYEINNLLESKKIPVVPIYLDSPLAIKVTKIYGNYKEYFNASVQKLLSGGDDIFSFPGLKKTLTTEESRAILGEPDPKVIIAGSGMSNGGRIIHHEKHYLSGEKNTLLLVGYQAAGTPGRLLQEGVKTINILGEEVPVNAQIITISGYSAHKDSDALLEFVSATKDTVRKVFAVMGEPKSSLFFVQKLRDYLGVDASAPQAGESVWLDMN